LLRFLKPPTVAQFYLRIFCCISHNITVSSSSLSNLFHSYQKGNKPIELATIKQQNSRKKTVRTKNTKVKSNKDMKNTTNATSPLANSYDIKSYKRKKQKNNTTHIKM